MKYDELVESILNGLAKNKSLEDIAVKHNVSTNDLQKELTRGIKIEHEHTKKADVAKQIAMDHLWEDPKYYTKLSKIEA